MGKGVVEKRNTYIDQGALGVELTGIPFSAANLSRSLRPLKRSMKAGSRHGAMTSMLGLSAWKASSKRIWSFPFPVQPCDTDTSASLGINIGRILTILAAMLFCDSDLAAGDHRASKRCAQKVPRLKDGIALDSSLDDFVHELTLEVFANECFGAELKSLLLHGSKVYSNRSCQTQPSEGAYAIDIPSTCPTSAKKAITSYPSWISQTRMVEVSRPPE